MGFENRKEELSWTEGLRNFFCFVQEFKDSFWRSFVPFFSNRNYKLYNVRLYYTFERKDGEKFKLILRWKNINVGLLMSSSFQGGEQGCQIQIFRAELRNALPKLIHTCHMVFISLCYNFCANLKFEIIKMLPNKHFISTKNMQPLLDHFQIPKRPNAFPIQPYITGNLISFVYKDRMQTQG